MVNLWNINSESDISEGGDECLGIVSMVVYMCVYMGFCFCVVNCCMNWGV